MDTAWIQVFVLTIAECAAPAGKTVCQEREFDLQFLTRADCEIALEQLVTLKDESATVIVDRDRSSCAASARESEVFASPEDVRNASAGKAPWKSPDPDEAAVTPSAVAYEDRLANLPDCEDYDGRGACRMGGIIVESASEGEVVEIWKRDQ
jgi:hypothetical protein